MPLAKSTSLPCFKLSCAACSAPLLTPSGGSLWVPEEEEVTSDKATCAACSSENDIPPALLIAYRKKKALEKQNLRRSWEDRYAAGDTMHNIARKDGVSSREVWEYLHNTKSPIRKVGRKRK